jgi:hypothetical protein
VIGTGRDLVGLYNWESAASRFDVSLEKLGLNPQTEYVAFDFWGNRLLPAIKGRLQLTLPEESSMVLAVRPRANHPQVISTSRHVTQGIVDLSDEKWDAATKTLSGRSKLVGRDPYELRIVSGAANVEKVTVAAAGVSASHAAEATLTRVKLVAPTSQEVAWSIQFK